jgi:hypothetical protein
MPPASGRNKKSGEQALNNFKEGNSPIITSAMIFLSKIISSKNFGGKNG